MKKALLIAALVMSFTSLSAARTTQEKIRDLERSLISLKEEMVIAQEDSFDMGDDMVDLDLDFGGGGGGYVPHVINFVITNGFSTQYVNQEGSNSHFGGTWVPGIIFRYGHEWLFQGSFLYTWFNKTMIETWLDAWVAYFPCDCFNIRAGFLSLPFGIYIPKVVPTWIKKLPSDPILRNQGDMSNLIAPQSVWGANFQATYDLCCWGGCFRDAFLGWDCWIGNGLCEESSAIDIDGILGGFDNNRDKAFGARASFWLTPAQSVGISGMRSRWNNNPNAFGPSIPTHLYYWAVAADISWIFCDYYQILGEYIYAEHKALTGEHITEHGYWLEFSAYLGAITECFCMNDCWKDFLESLQFVVRGSSVWTERAGFTRHQASTGFCYYFNNVTSIKSGYDFHWGNPGFDNDRFSISCAIEY